MENKKATKKKVLLHPVVSEKSYALADSHNKYTFMVPTNAEKVEIGRAVETEFKVKVVKVNTVTKPGKLKKDWKTNRRSRKSDKKKAIVTVKPGDKIEDFLGI